MPSPPSSRDRFLHHFLECESALRGFIASVAARPADREDLVQEVALRLWQLYERYDGTRPFTPWAIGVAARLLKEESRKAALAACVEALPETSAALIRARYYQHQEIGWLAESTGRSAASVYQNLCRLRRRLAECIRQRLRVETPAPAPRHVR